jgi:protein TonB
MAYLQQTAWKDRPGAVAGVIAIHAAIGYVLINGLGYVRAIVEDPPLEGYEVQVPLDPPPPPPVDDTSEIVPERKPVAPLPPLDLSDRKPIVDTTPIILPPIPDIPRVVPSPTPAVDIGPRKPAFDPLPPRPRGDKSTWVTTSDYRSSWINREWTGTATFRLEVAASGRVESCTITASSGHAELDQATCDLVSRRARFEPARDGSGAKAPGTYASAVRWELPR